MRLYQGGDIGAEIRRKEKKKKKKKKRKTPNKAISELKFAGKKEKKRRRENTQCTAWILTEQSQKAWKWKYLHVISTFWEYLQIKIIVRHFYVLRILAKQNISMSFLRFENICKWKYLHVISTFWEYLQMKILARHSYVLRILAIENICVSCLHLEKTCKWKYLHVIFTFWELLAKENTCTSFLRLQAN